MGTPTLFGDSDELAGPRLAACRPVVEELVALGVSREVAESYENRQAFAVLSRLRRDRAAVAPAPVARPLPGEADDPHAGCPAPLPLRQDAAAVLADVLAADPLPADELYRVVRCCLYVLSAAELRRVAAGLIKVLKAEGGVV